MDFNAKGAYFWQFRSVFLDFNAMGAYFWRLGAYFGVKILNCDDPFSLSTRMSVNKTRTNIVHLTPL